MDMCDECYIVYDSRDCPLCIAKEEIEDLGKRIEILEEEVKNLQKE